MLANSATTRNSRARRGSTASDISTGSRKKINNTTTIKTPQKAWSQSSSTKKTSNPPSSSSIKQSDSTCSIASKAGSTDQTNKSTVPPPPPRLRAALNHPTKSSRTNPQVIAERYEMLMQLNNRNDRELRENLKKLRTMVLREGLLEGSEVRDWLLLFSPGERSSILLGQFTYVFCFYHLGFVRLVCLLIAWSYLENTHGRLQGVNSRIRFVH